MVSPQTPRDLGELSRDEVKTIFESFDTVLMDCDGVLWLGNTPIPGSCEVVKKLKELGKKVLFVSNNAVLTPEMYLKKFATLGYDVHKDDIIIPSVVIAEYLKARGFQKKAFVVASSAFKQTLRDSGIQVIEPDNELKGDTIYDVFAAAKELDVEVGAVILDFDINITYMKLVNATTLLQRYNPIFVVGASDLDSPLTKDITLFGPGHFLAILESITGQKATVIGKPSPVLVDVISRKHPIVPERTLVIGDSKPQDIKLGNSCGIKTLIVLSGISEQEGASEDPEHQPTYYISTLGKLLPLLQ